MYGIIEGIKNGSQVVGDIVGNFEGVECWNYQIFGEVVWVVNVDVDCVVVQMGMIVMIVVIVIVGDMVFVRNVIVNFEVFYFLINIYYFIDIFMVYDYWYWDGFL